MLLLIFPWLENDYLFCLPLGFCVFNSLNESIFQETDAAVTIKEIRMRDP